MRRPVFVFTLTVAVLLRILLYLGYIDGSYKGDIPTGGYAVITGKVTSKEYKKDTLILSVRDESYPDWDILCYMKEGSGDEPSVGMTVRVSGRASDFPKAENPGEFDSRAYYNTLSRAYRIYDGRILGTDDHADRYREFLCVLRHRAGIILDESLSEEDAGVMRAVLLGDRAELDDATRQLFSGGGIMHILAVSGLHITILGMGVYRILRSILRGIRGGSLISAVISVFLMFSYGTMCGMSASACRAIVMFTVRLMAPLCGRTYDMLTGLSVAALLLIAEQPLYVCDSGFMLSFGAVMAVGILVPELGPVYTFGISLDDFKEDESRGLLQNALYKVTRGVKKGLMSSAGIALFTLPVYAASFHTFPMYSPFINLAVLPLMGMLMVSGLLCLSFYPFLPAVSHISSLLVHLVLGFYRWVCDFSLRLPNSTWYMGHTTVLRVVLYLLFIMLFIWTGLRLRGRDRDRLKWWTDPARYALIAASVVILCAQKDSPLRITFLSVGQGDGIVIESGERTYLIDGGSSDKDTLYRNRIKPFLAYEGIGELDAVFISHEDEDHMSGVKDMILDMEKGGIRIGNLILPDVEDSAKGENYRLLEELASSAGIPVYYIGAGMSVSDRECSITCLAPGKEAGRYGANEHSMVLYLSKLDFNALFTGDLEGEGEEALIRFMEKTPRLQKGVTLLKVAHHGSRNSTGERFLSLVKPKIAVISCAANNSYGHPHAELLERLYDIGAKVYRTPVSGAVTIETDGRSMSVSEFMLCQENA